MFKMMWIAIMIIIAVFGIGGTLLLLRTKWSNPVRVPIIMTILATIISSEIVIGLVIWSPSSGSDEEAASVQAEKLSDEENTGPLTAEKEPNDTIKEANFIAVNSEVYGTLKDEDDVDYYYYEIEQRSSVSLDFFHDQIDDESEYCEISMFSIPQGSDISNMKDDPEKIESYEIYGNRTNNDFSKLHFNPGVYCLKIEAINSGEDASGYHFRVNASVEEDNTEKEPNDDISLAKLNNSISLNTLFTGNIQTYDDTDYYHFKISKPGILNIKFSHDFIDTDRACWEITVLGGVIENGISARIPGNVTDFEMDTMRLSPAEGKTTTDYYLKIESGNEYVSSDYNFIINYSPEASWEIGKTGPYLYDKEPNNEPSSATQIELNTEISGNIQTDSDVDYYEINVPGDGMISLTFEHEFIDSDRVLWAVDLLGGAGGDDMEFPNIRSTGQQENLTSGNARIPAGVYYVRVKPSQYDNSEYKLKVNYAQ